jgi:nucleoside-diphosphate kinase
MERSLVLVKPDAMQRELAGAIVSRIQKEGLKLIGLKMLHMDRALAERHYGVHKEKPFFKDLVDYITSTPIVAAAFEGQGAVERIRKLMGATDPAKAAPGTIRKDYGLDLQRNSTHASDSPENAVKEIAIFFTKKEIFS